jgi:hypothetical protein
MAADRAAERGLRARAAPGVRLVEIFPPDGDPDRALLHPNCRVLKLQRKVVVGRVETPAGVLFVKRYNVFAWRVALAGWMRSPAFRAWSAAEVLAAGGFGTPEVVAAIEYRCAGWLRRSFFVTREVTGAVTADQRWRAILADPLATRRRAHRRAFARALGDLFRRLHAAGLYHNDLKDVNVLVRGPAETPACVLLDLEGVRQRRRIGRGRRVKNIVQLDRTLGRQASAADRLRFLRAYLGAAPRAERRAWAAAVRRAAAAKDRRGVTAPSDEPGPRISCTVVCQDEEAHIGACLESVSWCDEIVVVDGGSCDRTPDVARRFTDRVITNPWPGYRAQKQFALDAATGDWVLNVDADERVTAELAAEIRAALAHVPEVVDGFAIPRLVAYLDRWWYRGGWYPRRILRLVRRRRATWGGVDPHERPVVPGRVIRLEHPLIHYTYINISDHLRTVRKLTGVAAMQVGDGARTGIGRLVLEPSWRFVRSYLIKGGVLEGLPGLFVAATDAFYTFLRWARVWERRVHAGDR